MFFTESSSAHPTVLGVSVCEIDVHHIKEPDVIGKRKALRLDKVKNRNEIRVKMGKPVYFTLTHCKKKRNGFLNCNFLP